MAAVRRWHRVEWRENGKREELGIEPFKCVTDGVEWGEQAHQEIGGRGVARGQMSGRSLPEEGQNRPINRLLGWNGEKSLVERKRLGSGDREKFMVGMVGKIVFA